MAAAKVVVVYIAVSLVSSAFADKVLSLTEVNFDNRVFGSSTHFVMFYGPWYEITFRVWIRRLKLKKINEVNDTLLKQVRTLPEAYANVEALS